MPCEASPNTGVSSAWVKHDTAPEPGVTIPPQGGSPTAVVMAAGQQVCFAGFNVCWRYDTTAKRMKLRWNGQDVASIDSSGNARFLGAVTGNTTP